MELSKKAQEFVALILAGKPTADAHRLAGFKGSPHAAYELRSKLDVFIRQEAARKGLVLPGAAAAPQAAGEAQEPRFRQGLASRWGRLIIKEPPHESEPAPNPDSRDVRGGFREIG
jgi:hypothetical protein